MNDKVVEFINKHSSEFHDKLYELITDENCPNLKTTKYELVLKLTQEHDIQMNHPYNISVGHRYIPITHINSN